MNYYIGIDLGTSSVKGIVADIQGRILRRAAEEYPVYYPVEGWSEQNPDDWLNAVKKVLRRLTENIGKNVRGISFGGQMHGLIILDGEDNVIRPCILWNDGRTEKQTEYLNTVIGKDKLISLTANIAYAGFTAPKLLWIKENEPRNFAKIAKIMLPKDYLAYKLTGVHSTDYSDASGTLLLDVKHKRWSEEMCRICGVKREWLPTLYDSFEAVGSVKSEWNLPNAVVAAGAGDNAAAAIGTGTVCDGDCNISLGTSGTVFIAQNGFYADSGSALHTFAHANGKWHLMGCVLSAAGANKWWLEKILGTSDYDVFPKDIALGTNDVYFLPYLMGERSPHNDSKARGAFIGMRPDTRKWQMNLAVLEGVAFALRDCVEAARKGGAEISKSTLCGGGAKSAIWRQVISNVLNVELYCAETEQGPSFGAAVVAMVAAGEFKNVNSATEKLVRTSLYTRPDIASVMAYNERYKVFKMLYPALKPVFSIM